MLPHGFVLYLSKLGKPNPYLWSKLYTKTIPAGASKPLSADRPVTLSNGTTGTPIPPFPSIFAGTFFPDSNPTVQLINTAGIFAVGFLMRPIGGYVFGKLADNRGRKVAMTISVLLMSLGSLLIAFLPGLQQYWNCRPAPAIDRPIAPGVERRWRIRYFGHLSQRSGNGRKTGILFPVFNTLHSLAGSLSLSVYN